MRIFLITFFSYENNENISEKLTEKVKQYGFWARITQTCYCIKCENKTVAEIRSDIHESVGGTYRLFVVDVTRASWASFGLPDEVTDWLRDN